MTNLSGAIVWQASYDAFGKATVDAASSITNNLRFPGQYFDAETGLHYNWNRFYDPNTGRYVTEDPIGIKGGINLFSYISNNPINFNDFAGLFCDCKDACPSGYYVFTGIEYGGFLFFGGVKTKHLLFKCAAGKDMFHLTIQTITFGGGLGGGVQMPTGTVAGCNKKDVMSNISGWAVFTNVFPPGIPTHPGFGVGGDYSTGSVSGNAPYPLPSASLSPGYGLEVSAGGSYSRIIK
jgi:RHS repeat-associated protein